MDKDDEPEKKEGDMSRACYGVPACLALLLVIGVSTVSAQTLINGAGATFPYPIYSKWFDEYARIDGQVRFNYQSIGSG